MAALPSTPARRLALCLLACALLTPAAHAQQPSGDAYFALRKNFEIFAEVYEQLSLHYVDELDPERVMRRGMAAMLADLDPYTNFLDEYARAQSELLRGAYGSVGVTLETRGGQLLVVPPQEGSTTGGYAQGLRVGDVVQTLDGRAAADLTMQDVGAILRGAPGTAVELTVERAGVEEPLRFVLTRETADPRTVTFSGFVGADTSAGVGYIRLQVFGQGAGREVRGALDTLMARGPVKGLVLDLRGNPGGIVQDAVEIVGLFVPEGTTVVTLRGRAGRVQESFRTFAAPAAPEMPLVVLVDALSASASEIVAGALQDLDRAVILGETTYGKGLVQTFQPLPYQTMLKLTSGRYALPSGRSVQRLDYRHDGSASEVADSLRRTFATATGRAVRDGGGIDPDVSAPEAAPGALVAALEREARFFGFANRYAATHAAMPTRVDEALLDDFRAYLDREGFAYRTGAEDALDAFMTSLDEAGYARARAEAESLQQAIRREKAADFERHAPTIRERLRRELLARYASTEALARDALATDERLAQAIALIENRRAYDALLAGSR